MKIPASVTFLLHRRAMKRIILGMILCQGQVWARHVEHAVRWHERMRGLLGRAGLGDAAAMVIRRCRAVHTVGMKFAIDLVFIDTTGCIVRIERNVPPGRLCVWGGWRAAHVIESEAGRLDLDRLNVGDTLELIGEEKRPAP